MVPTTFANFFLATAGAGDALIGLLFVAISINPERTFGPGAARERQGVAANAFTALVNAFFVSTGALIPGTNVGAVALVLGFVGILNSLALGLRLVRHQLGQQQRKTPLPLRLGRVLFMVAASLALYGYELSIAWRLLSAPTDVGSVYALASVLMGVYGLGLLRAWELLGAPRSGLTGWLNPLANLEEETPGAPDGPPDL